MKINTVSASKPVKISVIVASRNEMDYIGQCLESLINQDYPKDEFEIIVVDGMSNDGTRDIILDFQKKHQNVILIDNPKIFCSAAMNLGIKKAKGDFIIKVDAHALVSSDFIRKNIEFLEKTKAACVGGPIKTIGKGYTGEAIALALVSFFGTGGSAFRSNPKFEGYVDTVPFGAYRRDFLEKAGLYEETMKKVEDLDLHARIKRLGGRFYMTPDIKSSYFCRSTIKGFIKQAFTNGYEVGGILNVVFFRHLVPFFFVSALLISFLLSFVFDTARAVFILILFSYLLFNIFFSLQIVLKKGKLKYLPIIPLIFAVQHLSYGVGTFTRIFNFLKKR